MIDRIYFETGGVTIAPYEDYGILLKSFDTSPPAPKVYRVALDGRDGSIDLSEWAGDVRFEDRTVEIEFRDMHDGYKAMLQKTVGRRVKITKSDDIDWYFEGRCDSATTETRKRVTDIAMMFTCTPWKLAAKERTIEQTVGSGAEISLSSARRPVVPTVTLTAACTLTWNGVSYAMQAGTHTPLWLIVRDTANTLTVSGSGKITLTWRDGVL